MNQEKSLQKKILVIGSGPLPNDEEGIREASGLRTEQFIRPLIKAGHEVHVFCIHNTWVERSKKDENKNIIRSYRSDPTLLRQVRQKMSKMSYDVIIGVNTFPAFIASKCIDKTTPFWADLNGWIMAEAQARGFMENHDNYFANAWRQEVSILKRADIISTVSEAQKFAVIGEMTACGQMRHDSFLENSVIPIENCTKWFDIDKRHNCLHVEQNKNKKQLEIKYAQDIKRDNVDSEMSKVSKKKSAENMFKTCRKTLSTNIVYKEKEMRLNKEKNKDTDTIDKEDNINATHVETSYLFRKNSIPSSAFVIAWIGGYNNWVDEKILFESIEKAMQQKEDIYFVSTGGDIGNVAGITFQKFKNRINSSVYKNRFIFLGWIPTHQMQRVYEESNVGINIDFNAIETQTGARNRINEMMKFGLPVISTNGSEIAKKLSQYNAGIAVEYGNASAITQAIIEIYSMTEKERSIMGENGQKYIFTICHEDIVMKPLLSYVKNPFLRNKKTISIQGVLAFVKNIIQYAKDNGYKKVIAKILQYF